MASYSRILIPVDFSDHSREAVRQACDLARRFDAEIHLLHVLDSWPAPAQVASEFRPQMYDMLAEQRALATQSLANLPGADLGPKPVVREMRTGRAVPEILKYADENHIDLIVLGTHGRTGVVHWLMGSVAEKVVQYAHCPVLVVRPSSPSKSAA
jgi:nucleotide-binding universal stress UspA family protein